MALTRRNVAVMWTWTCCIAVTSFLYVTYCLLFIYLFVKYDKTVLLQGNFFSLKHIAWNSAGLNLCIMKQQQSDLNFQCHAVFTALANCLAATQKWTTICIVCTNLSTCIVLRQLTPFTRFLKKFPNETIDKEHIQTMLLSRRSENRGFSSCADHLTVLTTCILWVLKAACPCFTFPHFP